MGFLDIFRKKPTVGEAVSAVGETAETLKRVFTGKIDPLKQAEFEYQYQKLAQEIRLAQIKVNEKSAEHPSLFVAGGRPAFLWTCNLSFLMPVFLFVTYTFVTLFSGGDMEIMQAFDHLVDKSIEMFTAIYMPVTLGLLGLGGMRTYEAKHGIKRNSMAPDYTKIIDDLKQRLKDVEDFAKEHEVKQ